jgi:hypothetical protein
MFYEEDIGQGNQAAGYAQTDYGCKHSKLVLNPQCGIPCPEPHGDQYQTHGNQHEIIIGET